MANNINIDVRLHCRLMAEINRHHNYHEAARTAINATVLSSLRSMGPIATADFLLDAAEYLERQGIAEVLQ